MNNSMFKHKYSDNYYLVTNKAHHYNVVLEFNSFNSKLLSNDDLRESYIEVSFNGENVSKLFAVYPCFKDMCFDDFNDFKLVMYYNRVYKLNNWQDVFNFISSRI